MALGQLEKLKIEAYSDAKFQSPIPGAKFEVMFNPQTISYKYEIESKDTAKPGSSGSASTYNRTKPRDLTLDLMIDGTGATGTKVDVSAKISEFLKVVYEFKGEDHKPPYLKIIYGKDLLKCIFKSANIQHSLFKPDGTSLRAKITTTFTEFIEDKARSATEGKTSPDLTHLREIKDGDSLPLMVYNIYGDSKYYFQVARINNLKNLKKLKTGQKIYFPPLTAE